MPSELFVRRLLQEERLEFECSDDDLTEFFRDDCPNYLRELLAVTYSIELGDQVIAMFSLCNDRLDVHDFDDDKKQLKKAAREQPHMKRGMQHFPAVKIARLAVRKRLGIKWTRKSDCLFHSSPLHYENKTGCRFLTVDAYPEAIGFYEKVGFKKVEKAPKLHDESGSGSVEEDPNVLMYLDLGVMIDSPKVAELSPIVDQLLAENRAKFSGPPPSVREANAVA
jgi:hypothetical protein